MYHIKIIAWVKNSPNTVPIAEAQFRSDDLAYATARLWAKDFRVEQVEMHSIATPFEGDPNG